MAMTTRFIENKLCKASEKILHFKSFRKIKANKTGPNKGRFQGWTDSEGGKRFATCTQCEKDRFNKSDATVDEIRKVADFYEKLLKDK